jgi:hypothetical protein
MTTHWTKPYCGIRHHTQTPKHIQITISELGPNMARVYLLNRNSSTPFTAVREEFGSLERMIKLGETWAEELMEDKYPKRRGSTP